MPLFLFHTCLFIVGWSDVIYVRDNRLSSFSRLCSLMLWFLAMKLWYLRLPTAHRFWQQKTDIWGPYFDDVAMRPSPIAASCPTSLLSACPRWRNTNDAKFPTSHGWLQSELILSLMFLVILLLSRYPNRQFVDGDDYWNEGQPATMNFSEVWFCCPFVLSCRRCRDKKHPRCLFNPI